MFEELIFEEFQLHFIVDIAVFLLFIYLFILGKSNSIEGAVSYTHLDVYKRQVIFCMVLLK